MATYNIVHTESGAIVGRQSVDDVMRPVVPQGCHAALVAPPDALGAPSISGEEPLILLSGPDAPDVDAGEFTVASDHSAPTDDPAAD